MDANWIEFKCSSGRTLFVYNKMTGEHKWPINDQTNVSPQRPDYYKEMCSIGIQTDENSCSNGCTSKYINTSQQTINTEGRKTNKILKNIRNRGVDHNSQPLCHIEQHNLTRETYEQNSYDVFSDEKQSDSCAKLQESVFRNPQQHSSFVEHHTEQEEIPFTVVLDQNQPESSSKEALQNSPCQQDKECPVVDYQDSLDGQASVLSKNTELEERQRYIEEIGNVIQVLEETSNTSENSSYVRYKAINSGLAIEKMMMQDGKPFECSYCGKRFSSNNNLTVHLRTHTGEKPFECSYCKRSFSLKQTLTDHIKIHTGEKPFECTLCDKKYARRKYLKVHQRVHTGEKPFPCPHCEKRFIIKKALIDHVRIHTGERPYECSYCKKTFMRNAHLREHVKQHTGEKPFQCDICKKNFVRMTVLRVHQKIHSGEKPFECSVCQKKFSQKRTLMIHMKSHSEEKPFECSHCLKKFKVKKSLKNHLLKKHNLTVVCVPQAT